MPDMFSELMATFFANLLPYLALLWSISFWVFISRSEELTQKKKILSEDETRSIAILSFVVAFLFILAPIRSCIVCICGNPHEANESNIKPYKDVALTFSTDYDKSNPLTSK